MYDRQINEKPLEKLGQNAPAPTPKETLYRIANVARTHLKNMYVGNV